MSYVSSLDNSGLAHTLHFGPCMEQMFIAKEKILSFRSSGVMYYETPVQHRRRLMSSALFKKNASRLSKRERYKGKVTIGAKKRLRRVITLLLQSTPQTYKVHPVTQKTVAHKLSFITVTTPTHVNSYNAKWCHKNLLEPLLRTLRRKYQMKSYLWKCELQDNGQVHYHITVDIMLNHSHLKNEWNNLLRRHDMLNEFKLQYGHDDPNSTDIHAVHKINNLEAYLVKYICKEYQNETAINAKIWDCSKNLKQADYFKIHVDKGINEYLRSLQKSLLIKTSYFEHSIFLDFKTTDYYAYFNEKIVSEFAKFLDIVREGKYLEYVERNKQMSNINTKVKWVKEQTKQICNSAMKLTGCNTHTGMYSTGFQIALFAEL